MEQSPSGFEVYGLPADQASTSNAAIFKEPAREPLSLQANWKAERIEKESSPLKQNEVLQSSINDPKNVQEVRDSKIKILTEGQEDERSKQRHNEEFGMDFESEVDFLLEDNKNGNIELEQRKKYEQAKCEHLLAEYDSHKNKDEWKMQRFGYEMQILKLKNQLVNEERENFTLRLENEILSTEVDNLGNKIKVMGRNILSKADEASLCESNGNELQSHEKNEKNLIEKCEKLQHSTAQKERMQCEKHEMIERLEDICNNIVAKESEIKKISVEMGEIRNKNLELQKGIDRLITNFKIEKHDLHLAIKKFDEHICQMAKRRIYLEGVLIKLESEMEETKGSLNESKDAWNSVIIAVQEENRDLGKKLQFLSSQKIEKEFDTMKKSKEDVECGLRQQFEETKKELISFQKKCELKDDTVKIMQKQLAEEMEALIKIKNDEHTKYVREIRVEHERVFKAMEIDLKFAKEQIKKKDVDLQTTTRESTELKKKLTDEHNEYIKEMRVEHEQVLKTMECDFQLAKDQIEKKEWELQTTIRESSEWKRKFTEEHTEYVKEMKEVLKTMDSDLRLAKEQIVQKDTAFQAVICECSELKKKLTEDHTKYVKELKVEHQQVLKTVEGDLRLAKEQIDKKDFELQTVIRECSELKKKLNDSNNRLRQLQSSYTKMEEKSAAKLQQLQLIEDEIVNTFLSTHKSVNEMLEEAEGTMNELSCQLSEEAAWRTELDRKLQASEMLLAQIKLKLENQSQVESDEIICLKTAYESQTAALEKAENHLSATKKMVDQQSETIESLCKCLEDKDNILTESEGNITTLKSEIVSEKEKRLELLSALGQALEKSEKLQTLEKDCKELQTSIKMSAELFAKLENEINEKDAQFQRKIAEEEHEIFNLLSDKRCRLVEKELYEAALLNIVSAIKSHIYSNKRNVLQFVYFDKEEDTALGKVKSTLNTLLLNNSHAKEEYEEAISALETEIDSLKQEMIAKDSQLETTKDKLVWRNAAFSYKCLLKWTIRFFKSAKEKLIAENKKFKESQDIDEKRIHSLVVKLGKMKALCLNSQQENEQLAKASEESKSQIQKMHQEIDTNKETMCKLKMRLDEAAALVDTVSH